MICLLRTKAPSWNASASLCFALVMCLTASTGAFALDGTETPADAKVLAPGKYKNTTDAFRQAIEADKKGDVQTAIVALEYAADSGRPLALWKLGHIYADGVGVNHDDAKAYDYFLRLVESYDDDDLNRGEISVISSAFVSVGIYTLKGIQNKVSPDPARAWQYFHFAATTFGNPNAQYNLARILLDGNGVKRDVPQAARWLSLAAEKSHFQSQALLGHLLFTGGDGIPRQRAKGLMWLTLARESIADPVKDDWVIKLDDEDNAMASDEDRQAAQVYMAAHRRPNLQ